MDEFGRILGTNCRADDLIRPQFGIMVRNERFAISRASIDRRFLAMVRAAAAVDACEGSHESLIGVPNPEGRTRLAIRLRRHQESGQPLVLLTIVDLQASRLVSRGAFAAVFGLSPREAEFAELFSGGLRVEDIAPQMGCRPNTARVHLRSIFLKTGCSNQIELARMFAMIR